MSLPFAPIDKRRIISSTEALELKEIPKHLIIVGGGVIGLELGSVYARIGSKVTVVEFLDSLIATMDGTMGKELQKILRKEGMEFYLGHKVTALENKGKEVVLKAEDKAGKPLELKGDYCLVSIGRRPYTEGLGLDKIGIDLDRGRIPVDEHLKTKVDNIYAIGDVVRGAMLAHKAEEEGTLVAEQFAGQKPHIHYLLIPGVVYTWPEVASVGYTEEQLKADGRIYKVGTFPYKALGRARASMDTDGLVKVLADKNTDEILGMHIIGARAADMIAAGVTAMEFRASAEDVARMSHAHPTYMEAVREACLAATANRPIHM
jgi:dihydrolipoamide dehydrogenase